MNAIDVLAVIPARGGSKGLPGKNVRELAGIPLIAHSILCAKMSSCVSEIVVSTDSEEIARVAKSYGAWVPFMRPAALASDAASMWPVIQHALRESESASNRHYDVVLLLDPTSPGRMPADIDTAIDGLMRDPVSDGVAGVSEPDFNPFWHAVVEENGYMVDLFPQAKTFARRQDVPTVYRINASLYAWKRDFVLSATDWRAGRTRLHVIPESNALHIDDLRQFQMVEMMHSAKLIEFPWMSS